MEPLFWFAFVLHSAFGSIGLSCAISPPDTASLLIPEEPTSIICKAQMPNGRLYMFEGEFYELTGDDNTLPDIEPPGDTL